MEEGLGGKKKSDEILAKQIPDLITFCGKIV